MYNEVVSAVHRIKQVEANLVGIHTQHHIRVAGEGKRILAAERQLHLLLPQFSEKDSVRCEERGCLLLRDYLDGIVFDEDLR